MQKFDYTKDFKSIDFRKQPEHYQVGKGEQGVLLVEPYKSELLPHWRFKTPKIAMTSSMKIYSMFLVYKKKNDFVGMDMARKFLQMGYTRARRYANHTSGRKYKTNQHSVADTEKAKKVSKESLPQEKTWKSNEKAESARIFYEKYVLAREDSEYKHLKKLHQEKFG